MHERSKTLIGGILLWSLGWPSIQADDPPFHGTIFISPDWVTSDDPTAFKKLHFAGRAERQMFDRRDKRSSKHIAWIFMAEMDDGQAIEVQVNPEFSAMEANQHGESYMTAVGRLPQVLRIGVKHVVIQGGKELFGGGNNGLLIHTEQGEEYIKQGILEETLFHEAAHSSLDSIHAKSERWKQAQTLDGQFISSYAKENPTREDIAETFLPYLMIRYYPDRVSEKHREILLETIPNRIKYFDSLQLDSFLYPFVKVDRRQQRRRGRQ